MALGSPGHEFDERCRVLTLAEKLLWHICPKSEWRDEGATGVYCTWGKTNAHWGAEPVWGQVRRGIGGQTRFLNSKRGHDLLIYWRPKATGNLD